MPLSCECYSEDFDWYYYSPYDYSILKTSKRKRCCSCKKLINVGSVITEFQRFRSPLSRIEENIYGEGGEVPLADWYMCEECSDLYFSLDELKFCIYITDNMKDLVKEYTEVYAKR